MPRREQRRNFVSRYRGLLFGLVVFAAFLYVTLRRSPEIDWPAVAAQNFAAQDYAATVEAADEGLRNRPGDSTLLFLRAQALRRLGLLGRSIDDLTRALELDPDNHAVLVQKSQILDQEQRYAEAIEFIDEALKRAPTNELVMIHAARHRVNYANQLRAKLDGDFDFHAHAPLRTRALLDEFIASPILECSPRTQLSELLPAGVVGDAVREHMDLMWTLLREADAIMGDLRTRQAFNAGSVLARAEIDLKFGRLLRAKEELQTLLVSTSLDNVTRRISLQLLARVMEKAHVETAMPFYLRMVTELDSSLPLLADRIEAEFQAATIDPGRRPAFLQLADQHLQVYRSFDVRSVGYRGLAALEWQEDPELAIGYLREVYETLRLHRAKDPSLQEPRRARRFMLGLLDAYLAAHQADRGLEVASKLIDIFPQDGDLRRRRARAFETLGDTVRAEAEYLQALRCSPRDNELFDKWLEMAAHQTDAAGRTPEQQAREMALDFQKKKEAIAIEMRALATQPKLPGIKLRLASSEELTRTAQRVTGLAEDPVFAWHLANEFGRIGETGEARTFLFKAKQKEPHVPVFHFRLAQLWLDDGENEEAAVAFEDLLRQEPTDPLVAYYAALAWELAGDVQRARRVRADTILASPEEAGLRLCVLACLQEGDLARAAAILAPHGKDRTGGIAFLTGCLHLAAGRYSDAVKQLEASLVALPTTSDVLRMLLLAYSLNGQEVQFRLAADQLAASPRLLPLTQVEQLLAKLEEASRFADAAYLAEHLSHRFPRVTLRLTSRAAVNGMLAGNSTLLAKLRDDAALGTEHDDDVVRAAFGLTLREQGARPAAAYLKQAREFTERRNDAALASAAAFVLTPFRSEAVQFLLRYELLHADQPIPWHEAAAWSIVRRRVAIDRAKPALEPGVQGEIDRLAAASASDPTLEDEYLRFFLFRYAGRAFETDCRAIAEPLVAKAPWAATPASFLCELIEREEGSAAAIASLDAYRGAQPTDFRLYVRLGDLLQAEGAAEAPRLRTLARAGRDLFPDAVEPHVFLARAELGAGDLAAAREAMEAAHQRFAGSRDVLALRLDLARATGDEDAAAALAREIGAAPLADGEMRDFVVERYASGAGTAEEQTLVLGALVAADPTFYQAAHLLARVYAAEKDEQALADLVANVAAAVPSDRGSAARIGALLDLIELVRANGLVLPALSLADAAIFAHPAHVELRRQRVSLLREAGQDARAIDDLRLLCVLAPRDPDLLFEHASVLLEERTDLAQGLMALLGDLREAAGDDVRVHALRARMNFMGDRFAPAIASAMRAQTLAPGDPEFLYLRGMLLYLSGDVPNARRVLGFVTNDYVFAPRAQDLIRMIDAATP